MSQHNRPGLVRLRKTLAASTLIAIGAGGWSAQTVNAQDDSPFDINRADSQSEVTVSEYMTVELHVQDEELSSVLQLLSLQSQRNIVVSNDVSATVTADLYGVTFYEAMDAILHVNGYGYVEQGNFLFVYTLDEIAQIEAANRTPITKVIRLNYLNATDAASFVEPLLSEIGQIKTNGAVDTFSIPDESPVGDESFALSATMVISDYAEHVEEIERLILDLDTKPSQVLVEATILQTQLNEANAFGVDFSIIGNVNFTDFINTGGPLGAANAIQSGGDGSADGLSPADNNAFAVGSTPGGTGGASTLKIGVVQDDFAIFMRLLDEVTDFSVLSNPKILALNRQPARVLVGRRLGYLNTTATETSTTQTVEFLDTGTQLRFRPFISRDGMIRMELNPSVSEGFIRESVDSSGVNVSIPDEVTQELTTNVIVRDGSTIVLGGLFKETTTLTRKQVPILGDIPIVGAAFRGHDDSISRSEIIFLITPTIVNDSLLADQGKKAGEYIENVRTGSRQGLLPFSREKMTAQLNVEAERLANDGDVDGALWRLRRSLELNPLQPEAINLRERLVNKRDRWPNRSLMESIVRDYGVSEMRRHAREMDARGESGEWVEPGENGPVGKDPFIVKGDAIQSSKLERSPEEHNARLDDARARFAPPVETTGGASVSAETAEDEYLFELESPIEFDTRPIDTDPGADGLDSDGFDAAEFEQHEFDRFDPRGDASDAEFGGFDEDETRASAEETFGPNIVEFFNGEPSFSNTDSGSNDEFMETTELASGMPDMPDMSDISDTPTSPYFLTFGGLWTPFGAWTRMPNSEYFDETGLPIVNADEQALDENTFENGTMEDSTYTALTNLLDKMFETPAGEAAKPESEIAEVETDNDGVDQ
jgi:type IV pilus secretin PilQ/predicted competence protein